VIGRKPAGTPERGSLGVHGFGVLAVCRVAGLTQFSGQQLQRLGQVVEEGRWLNLEQFPVDIHYLAVGSRGFRGAGRSLVLSPLERTLLAYSGGMP